MSTILNSSHDNTNLMVNEPQPIDSNLTKKFLTGYRGKIKEVLHFFQRENKRNRILDCNHMCC
jgi:hypothetical protein